MASNVLQNWSGADSSSRDPRLAAHFAKGRSRVLRLRSHRAVAAARKSHALMLLANLQRAGHRPIVAHGRRDGLIAIRRQVRERRCSRKSRSENVRGARQSALLESTGPTAALRSTRRSGGGATLIDFFGHIGKHFTVKRNDAEGVGEGALGRRTLVYRIQLHAASAYDSCICSRSYHAHYASRRVHDNAATYHPLARPIRRVSANAISWPRAASRGLRRFGTEVRQDGSPVAANLDPQMTSRTSSISSSINVARPRRA